MHKLGDLYYVMRVWGRTDNTPTYMHGRHFYLSASRLYKPYQPTINSLRDLLKCAVSDDGLIWRYSARTRQYGISQSGGLGSSTNLDELVNILWTFRNAAGVTSNLFAYAIIQLVKLHYVKLLYALMFSIERFACLLVAITSSPSGTTGTRSPVDTCWWHVHTSDVLTSANNSI